MLANEPYTVAFLMVERFSMIAFTSAIEVLRLADYVAGKELHSWRLYSVDGLPVRASCGIAVASDGTFAAVERVDEVVVCTGVDVQAPDHGRLIAALRKLAARGTAIGAVCTGAYVLAKAGLLDGYRCAIHWENLGAFREEFPDLEVGEELYEIDRQRFTCAGGTAAIDMMLARLRSRLGAELAAQVTDELIHHRLRDASERQRMELQARLGVAHPKLIAVVALMERSIENPLSCTSLARRVKISARQLERLFHGYLETTPTRYYLRIRLERAKQLLRQTSMPILSVGLACGFVSASHFSKSYNEHFKKTPSAERRPPRGATEPARELQH